MKLIPNEPLDVSSDPREATGALRDALINTFGYRRMSWPWRGGLHILGYGHYSRTTTPQDCSQEQALDLLEDDVAKLANIVNKRIKVPITTPMFSALCYIEHFAGAGVIHPRPAWDLLAQAEYERAAALFHVELLGKSWEDREREAWGLQFQSLWRDPIDEHNLPAAW